MQSSCFHSTLHPFAAQHSTSAAVSSPCEQRCAAETAAIKSESAGRIHNAAAGPGCWEFVGRFFLLWLQTMANVELGVPVCSQLNELTALQLHTVHTSITVSRTERERGRESGERGERERGTDLTAEWAGLTLCVLLLKAALEGRSDEVRWRINETVKVNI